MSEHELPPHEPDHGRTGNPANWCERCRLEATPSVSRAAGGETLADLYGSVPDLIPNPMTSEAWVRRYRDGFDAGYARALSSAPAPEERPDGWVAVWHWTCACEGVQHRASVPQCSVCMAHRPAASPSGAGSPVAHRWERCSECGPMVICGHCGNNCCNGGSGDNCPDRCASAYAEQKAGWARLNASKAWHPAPPAAGREPSEGWPKVDRRKPTEADRDAARYRALKPFLMTGENEDGELWCLWCEGPASRGKDEVNVPAIYWRDALDDAEDARREKGEPQWGPDVDAMVDELVSRAALGASAQRNTGEGP